MKRTILVPRRDRDETAIAIVTLQAPSTFSKEEIFAGIKSAVTNWLDNSNTGKRIHPRVRDTFNVGDLSEHLEDEDLKKDLAGHAITIVKIEVLSESYPTEWEFDTHLYEEA